MSGDKKHLVIIGGGITGLAAAFYMEKEIKEKQPPLEVTLIEAGPRAGGKIQTAHKDGYIIERGPDSFLERKKARRASLRIWGLSICSSTMRPASLTCSSMRRFIRCRRAR